MRSWSQMGFVLIKKDSVNVNQHRVTYEFCFCFVLFKYKSKFTSPIGFISNVSYLLIKANKLLFPRLYHHCAFSLSLPK